MKLEVVIGKKENGKGRIFANIKEASSYFLHNEKHSYLYLREKLGTKIETKPKFRNEIKRTVYQNAFGEKRYYILKMIN